MTIAADNAVFLDTNLLIFANVSSAPLHTLALAAIQERHGKGAELWVSRQVLREYVAALSRPQSFTQPQPIEILVARVRYFESHFRVADEDTAVTEKLLALLESTRTGGKQVHDANIVATMQAVGIRRLLTHNVADFERFRSLITLEPLA